MEKIISNLPIRSDFKQRIMKILLKIDDVHNILGIEEVYLFGSCAKGNPHYASDIDLLLITPPLNKTSYRAIRDAELDDELGIPVQITLRTHQTLKEPVFFYNSIKESMILVRKYK